MLDATTDRDINSESKTGNVNLIKTDKEDGDLESQSLITVKKAAAGLKTSNSKYSRRMPQCIKQFTRGRYVFQRMLLKKIKVKVYIRLFKKIKCR